MTTFKHGDFVKLELTNKSSTARWCRHNILIYDADDAIFIDTYWGIFGNSNHRYTLEELEQQGTIEILPFNYFNMRIMLHKEQFLAEPAENRLYIPAGGYPPIMLVVNNA